METKTKKLTLSALMIALGGALSMFAVIKLPSGGSVTLGSMVPIILISFKYNLKWAVFTAFTYSVLQIALGFYPPPTQDFISFLLVILLDYVIAFTVLGFAGLFAKSIKNVTAKVTIGSSLVLIIRFICHFLSGIIIWYTYAPEGQSVYIYSLLYNGSYMLGELIITIVVLIILSKLKYFQNFIID